MRSHTEQLEAVLAATWITQRPVALGRANIVIDALSRNAMGVAQADAAGEAHRLAGTLCIYGFAEEALVAVGAHAALTGVITLDDDTRAQLVEALNEVVDTLSEIDDDTLDTVETPTRHLVALAGGL